MNFRIKMKFLGCIFLCVTKITFASQVPYSLREEIYSQQESSNLATQLNKSSVSVSAIVKIPIALYNQNLPQNKGVPINSVVQESEREKMYYELESQNTK